MCAQCKEIAGTFDSVIYAPCCCCDIENLPIQLSVILLICQLFIDK